MARERDDTGQYVETVAPDSVLDILDAVNGPVITSSDVAEHLNCTTEAARQKLRQLVDRGDLDRRKTGRTVVYWRPERETFDDADLKGDPDTTLADPDAEHGRTRPESEDTLAERVREYLETNDIPPKTEHGRDAVIDVFRYLREHGASKTGEIQDAVYPDYTEEWGSARTMWNALDRYLKNGDIPGVEKGGYGEWEYAGDERVRDVLRT